MLDTLEDHKVFFKLPVFVKGAISYFQSLDEATCRPITTLNLLNASIRENYKTRTLLHVPPDIIFFTDFDLMTNIMMHTKY